MDARSDVRLIDLSTVGLRPAACVHPVIFKATPTLKELDGIWFPSLTVFEHAGDGVVDKRQELEITNVGFDSVAEEKISIEGLEITPGTIVNWSVDSPTPAEFLMVWNGKEIVFRRDFWF